MNNFSQLPLLVDKQGVALFLSTGLCLKLGGSRQQDGSQDGVDGLVKPVNALTGRCFALVRLKTLRVSSA
jgi:hypothetical protein